MIFYLLGLLGYYKLRGKPVPAGICFVFFFVVTIPPAITLYFLLNKHWIFQVIAFAGGWFCWTFIEYAIHRFSMHSKENKHYHESLHFLHHIHPDQIGFTHVKKLFVTLAAAVVIGCSILFSAYLFLPAGILAGIALYGHVHWLLHQSWTSKWLGPLQRFHIHHHCKHPDKCFGVTVTWWDHIFGTAPTKDKEISERILAFYFKKEEKPKKKIFQLYTDEMINTKVQKNRA
jgi:sterol desaturase/sphingolipid hydroxylase (fatty acid hydroxylase superfamily)